MNIFEALGLMELERPEIAEEVKWDFEYLKGMNKELTPEDLIMQVDRLQDAVKKLKREGISMWNAKEQIPKIFDIVDGAFVVMKEVIKNQGEEK